LARANDLSGLLTMTAPDEAETLFREALEGRTEVLGAKHSETLMTASNLAMLLQSQGYREEAQDLMQQTWEECREAMGPLNVYTLTCSNNLAWILWDVGELDRLEHLLHEVLEGLRAILGPHHVDTLKSAENLSGLLMNCDKYHEAQELLLEVLSCRRTLFGEDHPDVLRCQSNLKTCFIASQKQLNLKALMVEDDKIVTSPWQMPRCCSKQSQAQDQDLGSEVLAFVFHEFHPLQRAIDPSTKVNRMASLDSDLHGAFSSSLRTESLEVEYKEACEQIGKKRN